MVAMARYDPVVHDPDYAHALASNAWELCLLGSSYHPSLKAAARQFLPLSSPLYPFFPVSHLLRIVFPHTLQFIAFSLTLSGYHLFRQIQKGVTSLDVPGVPIFAANNAKAIAAAFDDSKVSNVDSNLLC